MEDSVGGDCGCPEIVDPCDPCGNIIAPVTDDPCGSIMTPVVDECGPCGDSIMAPMAGDAYYEGEFLENGVPALPASSEVIEEGTGEAESNQETDPEVADAGEGEVQEHLTHDKIRKFSFLKRFQKWLS